MKIKSLLLYSFVLLVYIALTSSRYNPSNPPTGKTGAPSETTCVQSGCHGGGSFVGTVSVSGIPDTILPNVTYDVTLTQTSNAARAGFELTPLDGLNAKAGTLTAGSGSSVTTASGRTYIRQNNPKTLSGGSTSWAFKWKSPAMCGNNLVTLWFSSLAANGNGGTSGDNVLVGSKSYVFTFPTATNEVSLNDAVNIYPNPASSSVNVFIPVESAQFEMYNLDGKLSLKQSIAKKSNIDVATLEKGIYITKITYDQKTITKKIIVQ